MWASRVAAISNVAARQCGVVGAAQLRSLGIDRRAVSRAVAAGILRPLMPRTWAVGSCCAEPSLDAWRMSALLSAGEHALISHESAAELLGVWDRQPCHVVHVTAPSWHATRPGAPVTFHRSTSLDAADKIQVGILRATSFERTFVDIATRLTPWQLCAVLREATFLGLYERSRLVSHLDRRSAQGGVAKARRAVALFDEGCAGTRSHSEDILLGGVLEAPIPIPLVCNPMSISLAGIEPDLAWPEARLVVEVDGGGHATPAQQHKDQANRSLMRDAGYDVLVVTARDARRRTRTVVREICRRHAASVRPRRSTLSR